MRQRFGPAARVVVVFGSIQRFACVELFVEQGDETFNAATRTALRRADSGRILEAKSAAGVCRDENAFAHQQRIDFFLRPIGIVTQQMALKGRMQKRVESLDIVTVARNLKDKR